MTKHRSLVYLIRRSSISKRYKAFHFMRVIIAYQDTGSAWIWSPETHNVTQRPPRHLMPITLQARMSLVTSMDVVMVLSDLFYQKRHANWRYSHADTLCGQQEIGDERVRRGFAWILVKGFAMRRRPRIIRRRRGVWVPYRWFGTRVVVIVAADP